MSKKLPPTNSKNLLMHATKLAKYQGHLLVFTVRDSLFPSLYGYAKPLHLIHPLQVTATVHTARF